jgi:ElaB/YqjD/DUF883 family membrane-anchored ribosome-binding protein
MSTKKKPAEDAAVEELRSDIAETRAELGDTVEALAAKTDVKERAKETVRETAAAARDSGQQAVDRVEDSVRRRPASWGLALAGVIGAVIVLAWRRSRSRDQRV